MKRLLAVPAFLVMAGFLTAIGLPTLNWLHLWFPWFPGWLFFVLIGLMTMSVGISYQVPEGRLRVILHGIGEAGNGLALTFATLIGTADVVWLFWRGIPFREAGFVVMGIFFILVAYGCVNAYHIRVRRYQINVGKPCRHLRIAFLSDLHMGLFTDRNMIKRIADVVNSLEPDVVLIAGDFFDDQIGQIRRPEKVKASLGEIKSRLGTFGCWGNHDLFSPETERMNFLADTGIRILADETVDLGGLLLVGRKDSRDRERLSSDVLLPSLPKGTPVVVIDHNPRDMEALWANGADLVLSGHTHGGQTFPGNLFYQLMPFPSYGHLKKENQHGVVTSGAGFYGLPMRVGVSNEVVCIDLDGEEIPQGEEPCI